MAEGSHDAIETFQAAGLSFPPDASTAAAANVSAAIYAEAAADPVAFWAKQARERPLHQDAGVEPPLRGVVL